MLTRNSNRKTVATRLAGPALGALVALALAQPANAGGPIGIGTNVGAGAHVGAGANLPRVGAATPDANALENANGQFIADRKFGLDRAQERMSEQGAAHQKASVSAKQGDARRARANASARESSRVSAQFAPSPAASAASGVSADASASTKP